MGIASAPWRETLQFCYRYFQYGIIISVAGFICTFCSLFFSLFFFFLLRYFGFGMMADYGGGLRMLPRIAALASPSHCGHATCGHPWPAAWPRLRLVRVRV